MNIKDAIIQTIGKQSFDGMQEAGVSDLSILENACLTAFIGKSNPDIYETLRTALAEVWDKPPDTFKL